MTETETRVTLEWKALPYHGYTGCFGCGQHRHCCGVTPETRVCLICFEFTFNCRAPRRRRAAT